MKRIFTVLLLLAFCSCTEVRRTTFNYEEGGVARSANFLVPAGSRRVKVEKDSAGNTIQLFQYKEGSFYIAHLKDTATRLQPIIYGLNIAKENTATGSVVYKGQDGDDQYWREVRQGRFRVGYRDVPVSREYRFDSASNFLLYRTITPSN